MRLKIEGTADYVIAKIDPLDREALQDLNTTIERQKDQLVSRSKAKAHVKTGAMRDSIAGETRASSTGVTGSVFANPTGGASKGSQQAYYALFQEFGAELPGRDIFAKNAWPMKFLAADGTERRAWKVHFPGGKIDADKFIHGPFEEMRSRIIGEIRVVVDKSIARANS